MHVLYFCGSFAKGEGGFLNGREKKLYISHAGLGCKEKVLVVCITVTVVLLLHLLSCFLHNIVQQHTANFFTLQKKNEEGTKQQCSSGLCFTITPITPLVNLQT